MKDRTFQYSNGTEIEMPAPSGFDVLIDMEHLPDKHVTFPGFDFHARFEVYPEPRRRDPQLGRPALSGAEVWFTPDHFDRCYIEFAEMLSASPAMQYSNPYLGIGNNPVNYVDPDGEFAVLAGLIIKKAVVAVKAAKAAKLAAGAAKLAKTAKMAQGAASAAQQTTWWAKNAYWMKSGAINSLSNLDVSQEGFGWHIAQDFAAGAIGAKFGGMTKSKLAGMYVGGTLNAGFNAEKGDGFYEFGQNFVGGALSVWSGMGALPGEFSLFKKKSSYTMFKRAATAENKSFWAKNLDSFLKYGVQAEAYNFAYTDKKKFREQEWHQRALIAFTGGVMGAGASYSFLGNPWKRTELSRFTQNSLRSLSGGIIYSLEWSLSGWIKNRYKGGVKWGGSSRNKMWILGGKWIYGTANMNWQE